MFRRRRREDPKAKITVLHIDELKRLTAQVERLERTIAQLTAASDDVVIDLPETTAAQVAAERPPITCFADAWSRTETPSTEFDDFFAVGEVDKRARRWLLASN